MHETNLLFGSLLRMAPRNLNLLVASLYLKWSFKFCLAAYLSERYFGRVGTKTKGHD